LLENSLICRLGLVLEVVERGSVVVVIVEARTAIDPGVTVSFHALSAIEETDWTLADTSAGDG